MGTDDQKLATEFMAMDKAIYGTIPGITDKEEYTNSFYVSNGSHEFNQRMLQKKIEIEGAYHKLTSGGHAERINIEKNWDVPTLEKSVERMQKCRCGICKILEK